MRASSPVASPKGGDTDQRDGEERQAQRRASSLVASPKGGDTDQRDGCRALFRGAQRGAGLDSVHRRRRPRHRCARARCRAPS
eukprot:7359216-Prymnesium_polylepis.1